MVYALDTDGASLFVGGSFTTAAGVTRNRLAAFNAASGILRSEWSPSSNGTVRALIVGAGLVYIGGPFGRINNQSRAGLAAVESATGALDDQWRPGSSGGEVVSLAQAAGGRIVMSGWFSAINGEPRDYVAAVDATTGALDPFAPAAECRDEANPCSVLDVVSSGELVVGAVAGPGGRATAWRLSDSRRVWSQYGDGDVQALAIRNGVVYAGGHFDPLFGVVDNAAQVRYQLAAVDLATGALLPWAPRLQADWGVWAIYPTDEALHVGGYFTSAQQDGSIRRYVRLPALFTGPDTQAPTSPTDVRVVSTAADAVALTWAPSSDDRSVQGYLVRSNGDVMADVPGTQVTVAGLAPDTDYGFDVVAYDAAGNQSDPSALLAVRTQSPPVDLVAAGSVWAFRDDDVDLGTSWRDPGYVDADWPRGVAQLGYGDGDEVTVVSPNLVTYYLRSQFSVADAGSVSSLSMRVLLDDGAVVFLNGEEVWRDNMPAGEPVFGTRAVTFVGGAAEDAWREFDLPVSALVSGVNTVAVSLHNESSWSSDISFDMSLTAVGGGGEPPPDTVAPSVPQNVRVVSVGTDSAELAWDASDDAGSGVAGYRVLVDADPPVEVAGTQVSLVGLSAGSSYEVSVVAVDGAGNVSDASVPVTVTTQEAPDTVAPSVPQNVRVVSVGTDSAELAWDASDDAGSGVAGYRVLVDADPPVEVAGTQVSLVGLSAGSSYEVSVVAVDGAGNVSDASVPVTVTTQEAPDTVAPSVPQNVRVVSVGTDSAELAWDASDDAGSGVAGYRVLVDADPPVEVAGTQVSLVGLSAGSSYEVSVVAVDGAGNVSDASVPVTVTTQEAPDTVAPSVPQNVRVVSVGTDSAELAWDASDDAGSGVAGYRVLVDADPPVEVAGTQVSLVGLSAGSSYEVSVVAVDGAGNVSDASVPVTVTTQEAPDTVAPSVPQNVRVVSVGTDSAELAWDASDDAGSGVAGYRVLVDADPPVEVAGTQVSLVGLSAGSSYEVSVVAVDGAGNVSDASVPVTVTTQDDQAGPPQVVTVSAVHDAFVSEGSPTQNTGSSWVLRPKGGSSARVAYMSFEVPEPEPGRLLVGAALSLTMSSNVWAGGADPYDVRLVPDTSWDESTLTWQNRPAVSGTLLGEIPGGTEPSETYTVTLSAADIVALVGGQVSMAVLGPSSDSLEFWSSEHPGQDLTLTLTYQ